MTMEVETKDCTALSDAELGEMADMSSSSPALFDIGLLSKQREAWVLITQVRETGKLQGFGFCTLERIGGTPSPYVSGPSATVSYPIVGSSGSCPQGRKPKAFPVATSSRTCRGRRF